MSLIDAALSRTRTTIAVLLLLLIAGAVAFVEIPKEAEPDVNIPYVYVLLTHDGISPGDAERLLARPIETKLRGIGGVKEMRSQAYQGGASVLLEFEAGFDVERALNDVREKVDQAKPDLPADTDEPTVHEVNLSLFPVLIVTLGGDVPERTLLRIARDLRDRVEALPPVLEVKIGGDREELVEIVVDPLKLESYGIDALEVLDGLSRSNVLIAAGSLDTGDGRFRVQLPGLFEKVQDILTMPIKVNGDAVVTIGDVAEVRRTFRDRTTVARLGGKPAVALEVSKRTGENIIDTNAQVRALVEAERANWPAGIEVTYSQDKSKNIRNMLTDLTNNIVSAGLLVMVVIIGALGLRSGLLVGLAIPGSFLTAILVLQTMGLTVNIVVLFSLILAVGMLVDGAIVVTEYADRKLLEGEPPPVAYAMAARRMAWPIIASTATTLAAFAPLLFWPGLVGEFMKFLPITLVVVLSASLAMALLFVPVLGGAIVPLTRLALTGGGALLGGALAYALANAVLDGLLGLAGSTAGLVAAACGLAGAAGGFVLGRRRARHVVWRTPGTEESRARARALAADGDGNLDTVSGFTGFYVRVLRTALRRPALVVAGTVALLFASIGLYGTLGHGVEFFPDVEPEQAQVLVHARGNFATDQLAALVDEVDAELQAIQAERGEFASVYSLAGEIESRDELAEDVIGKFVLEFVDWEQRRKADDILADIRAHTAHIPGIHVEASKPRAGPPVGKPVQVRLTSRDPATLEAEAARLRAFFDRTAGLVEIEDGGAVPGIEWELSVDRAQAAKFGADVSLVGSFVQMVTRGFKVSSYRPDDSDDEIDIVVRFPEAQRSLARLDDLRVETANGQVPVSNFVSRHADVKTGTLRRVGGVRAMTVKADVAPGVLVDDKVREIRAWLQGEGTPDPKVSWTFKGEDAEQKAAQAFLVKAFGVALFIMAIILLAQFNSFYSAGLILFAVVMSTIGVFLGLLIIGQPFGIVMSGIGVIALAGIVVNNNIVLIDTWDRLKREVADPMEAILLTGAQRLRPVMLTTVTTILGLVPMVLQANIDFVARSVTVGAPSTQWWVQLSTAVAFGLGFATVLTLVVTPCALLLRTRLAAGNEKTDGRGDRLPPVGRLRRRLLPGGGRPSEASAAE